MSVNIVSAVMNVTEDRKYVGKTVFKYENHKAPYEITFYSEKGKDWDYSLSFASKSGDEEQFLQVDARIEEDDELFDTLLDAALDTLEESK
ncbi:hypothetical protein PASE110613_05750 [Paenibacillus sediminis]|uniref:DUF1292 domain-containing protein n=1 Tax=Paenibacillus sediminis TaxID=664909 RepID=A0ABS4H1N0_9BACL|nr:hypothetical protein [Paenibacillus sediminis]MBP1936282.1 hypothetical protein [Paenibacillus sediminis]